MLQDSNKCHLLQKTLLDHPQSGSPWLFASAPSLSHSFHLLTILCILWSSYFFLPACRTKVTSHVNNSSVFYFSLLGHEEIKRWNLFLLKSNTGTSLAVQWLRLHTPNAGGTGLIPGWRTKIPHAAWCGLKKKKK